MSELLKVNVSEHCEKKNGLTYLSWAWAWSEVLKVDPQATWEAVEFNGLPMCVLPDTSAMVKIIVTINGHAKSCWLPVMNHKNQAIKEPDAFSINTALVRCLTKTISMHGLGLYIYAGEDLPEPEPLISKEREAELLDCALTMLSLQDEGRELEATKMYYSLPNNDEKLFVWGQFRSDKPGSTPGSRLRSFIKANLPAKE
jgi:hypothetical protein